MGAVSGAWGWVSGVWNNLVAIVPVLFHAACQVAEQVTKTVTLP